MHQPQGDNAEKIVRHYLTQKRISKDVDAKEIVRILEGRSCAALEAIINEAGIYAAYE